MNVADASIAAAQQENCKFIFLYIELQLFINPMTPPTDWKM